MAKNRNLRSFAITLAITIAFTEARAFNIHREYYAQQSTDLDTAESARSEVKYKPEQITTPTASLSSEADTTVIALNDTKNTDNTKTWKTTKTPHIINRSTMSLLKKKNVKATRTSSVKPPTEATLTQTSTAAAATTRPSTAAATLVTSTPRGTIVKRNNETNNPKGDNSFNFTPETDQLNNLYEKKQSIHINNKFRDNVIATVNKTDTINRHKKDEHAKEVKNEVDTAASSNSLDATSATSTSTESVITTSIAVLDIIQKDEPNTTWTGAVTETINSSSDVTQIVNTETTPIADIADLVLPSWKKYTILDRKRTTIESMIEGSTASSKDMLTAETSHTSGTVGKSLSKKAVTSTGKLENDSIKSPSDKSDVTTEQIVMLEVSTSINEIAKENELLTTKLDVVSSKRAGFLDNTKTSGGEPEKTTKPTLQQDKKEISMYDAEGDEVADKKNVTNVVSQGQLRDDAIKEELLEENLAEDNKHLLKKTTSDSSAAHANVNGKSAELSVEDGLSVKPIGLDKKKALYIPANYKPMKKIDVQLPSKFIRDPDDNSWRNESISSLGIVFKAKNASKSFKEVLKNKTVSELASISEKENKSEEIPDLKLRLEKIAEVRKSKKKRINSFGETVYSDYEENSSESTNLTNTQTPRPSHASVATDALVTTTDTPTTNDLTVNTIDKLISDTLKYEFTTTEPTSKTRKHFNLLDYYDTTDDYADYAKLSKIDLKKSAKAKMTTSVTRPPELTHFTQPLHHIKQTTEYLPERKPTVQYFPPTTKVNNHQQKKTTPKVVVNDYDDNFKNKLNLYTFEDPTNQKEEVASPYGTISPVPTGNVHDHPNRVTAKPTYNKELDKNLYLTNAPQVTEPPHLNDGSYNRASYVIKHYKDFINEAMKDTDPERGEYSAYTDAPLRGVTINDMKGTPIDGMLDHDFSYETQFRKDILTRFVDNFNQNSEKFKVDFPIIYNSSIVHGKEPGSGKIASSSAFMKRLYEGSGRAEMFTNTKAPCSDTQCDNLTVELSPAYELHYYVPDQEEKEVYVPRQPTSGYRYRS